MTSACKARRRIERGRLAPAGTAERPADTRQLGAREDVLRVHEFVGEVELSATRGRTANAIARNAGRPPHQQICERLSIAPNTLRTHVQNITGKRGLRAPPPAHRTAAAGTDAFVTG